MTGRVTLDRRMRRRYVSMFFYSLVARHLPWSPRPGGKAAKRIRGFLAQQMLDECGVNVNVERGAWFGSGKGIRLGDRSDIGMDALVIGPVQIGTDVMMAPRCIVISTRHSTSDLSRPMNTQGFDEERTVIIEDDVWIGAGVTLLPGITVGRGSIVGAGSVLAVSVPPMSIVAGNPARVVRSRMPDSLREGELPS